MEGVRGDRDVLMRRFEGGLFGLFLIFFFLFEFCLLFLAFFSFICQCILGLRKAGFRRERPVGIVMGISFGRRG